MRFNNYLNEEKLYTKKLLEETITYDLYCKILECSYKELDYLVENCINEGQDVGQLAKSRGLQYIGFGRYAKKGDPEKVVAVSKGGKLVPVKAEVPKATAPKPTAPTATTTAAKAEEPKPAPEPAKSTGGEESDKIRIKNVATKLKKHINTIASDLGASKDHIVKAFQQKKVYDVVKHFGFSIGNLAKAAEKSISTLNVGLKATVQELEKTKALKKLKSGAIKVDQFLDQHKSLKKIAGVAVGGFMIYQWLNMTFSGDVRDDYDLSALPAALAGHYGMKDLLGTTNGIKGMIQLGVGLATGGGLPIWLGGVKGVRLALAYSGAKLAHQHDLAKKVKEKIKSAVSKTQQRAIASAETAGGLV